MRYGQYPVMPFCFHLVACILTDAVHRQGIDTVFLWGRTGHHEI